MRIQEAPSTGHLGEDWVSWVPGAPADISCVHCRSGECSPRLASAHDPRRWGPQTLAHSTAPQVQSYMEHHCHNATDRRILLMFLDICTELSKLCQHFEALHAGTPVTNNLLEKCKSLVSHSNDLSSLRAK